jgi:hypothetical protein
MTMRVLSCLTVFAIALTAADPSWKGKPMPAWNADDARQILNDSPWAKTVKAAIGALQTEDERRDGGNMGLPHGIGYDGFADDRPRPQLPKGPVDLVRPEADVRSERPSFAVQLRWESALPVRVAELKSGVVAPPASASADEGYIMAVYGVPTANVKGDPKALGEPLRSQAVLRREGKKDVKPVSAEVFQQQDGLVVVYVFPLSAEISPRDQRVEFDARIGRIGIAQSFDLTTMQFQGRLAL